MTEPADGLFSTADAARRLGVPAATIKDWKRADRIQVTDEIPGRGRRGRTPLYRLEELQPLADAYLARRARLAARTR